MNTNNAECRIVVFPSEMIEKSPQSGHTHATHCILHAALFVCLMADKPKFVFLAGVHYSLIREKKP